MLKLCNLTALSNSWLGNLSGRSHSVHCIFLDLAKAFDSVPHSHLLLKLECWGIKGDLLRWLKYFLTMWFQRVIISGSFSNWLLYIIWSTPGICAWSSIVFIVHWWHPPVYFPQLSINVCRWIALYKKLYHHLTKICFRLIYLKFLNGLSNGN